MTKDPQEQKPSPAGVPSVPAPNPVPSGGGAGTVVPCGSGTRKLRLTAVDDCGPSPVLLAGVELVVNIRGKLCTRRTNEDGEICIEDNGADPVDVIVNPQSARNGDIERCPCANVPTYLRWEPGQDLTCRVCYSPGPTRLTVAVRVDKTSQCDVKGIEPFGFIDVFEGCKATGRPIRTAPVVGASVVLYNLPSNKELTVRLRGADASWASQGVDQFHVILAPGQCLDFPPGQTLEGGLSSFTLVPAKTCVKFHVRGDDGTRLPGIPIRVNPTHGEPQTLTSDENGLIIWEGCCGELAWTPLTHELDFCDKAYVAPAGGRTSAGKEPVDVLVSYESHQHLIFGTATDHAGRPARNAVITIYDCDERLLARAVCDSEGAYSIDMKVRGKFRFRAESLEGTVYTDYVEVGQPVGKSFSFGPGGGGGAGVSQSTESIIDATAYPIMTEQVSPSGLGDAGVSARSGAPLGQSVNAVLRQVLGWKPRVNDPNGFFGALSQAFKITQFEGHTVATWVPRTYAVQTDLSGGITGAQAAILSQAQGAVTTAVPLIQGLTALRTDADAEIIDAIKSLILQQLDILTAELGVLGGPRPARVDQIFMLLTGLGAVPLASIPDPDNVAGELGNLRREMGLARVGSGRSAGWVNSIADEQNQTNYWVAAQYITGLYQAWSANRSYFQRVGGKPPFLGTQLVLISRTLSVTAETVEEVRASLESVFIGPAEQQTVSLVFTDKSTMFIDELLSWIYSFASDEGPSLVRDAGSAGIAGAFVPTAALLAGYAADATNQKALNTGLVATLPAGFFTPRVQRAFLELAGRLSDLASLASKVPAPTH